MTSDKELEIKSRTMLPDVKKYPSNRITIIVPEPDHAILYEVNFEKNKMGNFWYWQFVFVGICNTAQAAQIASKMKK